MYNAWCGEILCCWCSNGVGVSGVASQPTSRRIQLRANTKMELMKQQVEQEKLRRCAKPFTASTPFTRQSAATESSRFPECHIKVCITCVLFSGCSEKKSAPHRRQLILTYNPPQKKMLSFPANSHNPLWKKNRCRLWGCRFCLEQP